MTFFQQFLTILLPKAWAEDIKAESLTWMVQCPCGFERSVWESGGVRYKAKGSPRRLGVCTQCGERTWHRVYRKGG